MLTEREADELRLAFQMKETQTMNINRAKAIGAKEAYTKTTRTWSYYAGIGVCVIAALIMIASFAIAAYQMVDYYRGDHYTPIPEFVVDTSKNVSEHVFYTYYEGVKCNRNEEGYMNGELKNEMLGDTGDLNGDVGKEWLALYWTKDTSAGAPLKAGFTVRTGESGKKTPLGSRALALFGQENALNITDEKYSYKDGLNGLYLFFKQNTSTAGAVFTAGALFVTGTLACVGGLGLGLLLSNLKKKKERDASVPA